MTERPDGGWGWLVAIATFLNNVIVDGVKYSFGIMFVELVETFGRSKSETSWIMSIQVGIMMLSGPIVAALVNRFGCKTIGFVGTLISFAGFLTSTFVHSLYVMYVTFGLLAGFGFGMMTMPSFVTLARYFDKRLAFASGIAAMGSGFGTLVFNPLSRALIDKYTWRGTLLIEAGIVLNGLACALVLKQPKETSDNLTVNEGEVKEDDEEMKLFSDVDNYLIAPSSKSAETQELVNKVSKSFGTANKVKDTASPDESSRVEKLKDLHEDENKQTYEPDYDVTVPLMVSANDNMKKMAEEHFDISDISEYKNKLTEKNGRASLQLETDCKTSQEISVEIFLRTDKTKLLKANTRKSDVNINEEENRNSVKTETINDKKKSSEIESQRWFSFSPLKNPGFLFFLAANILIEMSLSTPFIFLPDMLLHRGFQKQDAVWMLFIIGLVSTISRIMIGFIADLRFVNRVKLCNLIVVLNGVFVVLCPFCFNYASFVAFSIMFGFSAGSSSSLRYVLLPDLFGVEMIADFCGITMFFSAFAALIGLPKAGALFDATGSYTVPFVVAGAELTISGILLFLIPAVQTCCKIPLQPR